MLIYYRKKTSPLRISLKDFVEKVWSRGNAPDGGARGPGFDYRV